MIHQYKNNGYNIVMDINSGAIHVVDELVYDVIALLDKKEDGTSIHAQLDLVYPAARSRKSPTLPLWSRPR